MKMLDHFLKSKKEIVIFKVVDVHANFSTKIKKNRQNIIGTFYKDLV